MYRLDWRIQAGIVLVLVASTCAVGFCAPASPVGVVDRVVNRTESRPAERTACCCGTKDGLCCGTGCCVRQMPNPVPADPPLRGGTERHESRFVAIAGAPNGSYAVIDGSYPCSVSLQWGGLLALATLQSQHVRIQT